MYLAKAMFSLKSPNNPTHQGSLLEVKELRYKVLAKQIRKLMQVCKTSTCIRTCEGWPNRFASWLACSQKDANFTHIQMTVLTYVGWPNNEKRISTCVWIWARSKSMRVHASHRRSTQVGGQMKHKFNASWKLVKVCLARALIIQRN